MSEATNPRRRWLRYSLRSFFVVLTVLCLWLGWNVNLVQQRKAMRAQELDKMKQHVDYQFAFINGYASPPTPPARRPEDDLRRASRRHAVWQRDYAIYARLKEQASPPVASQDMSALRKWLGDEAVELILVWNEQDRDLARARFPEAYVYLEPRDKTDIGLTGRVGSR